MKDLEGSVSRESRLPVILARNQRYGKDMKVLLLSAYDAESHRSWHQLLSTTFTEYQWTILTLPPRYFSWRMRGNSLSFAFQHRDVLEKDYDLLIATSMVDLSALRGFVPKLGALPTLVYFHENQFAYPASEQQFDSIEPQVLNLYTALAADTLAFNSAYNRDTFLDGAEKLLAKMPDQVPSGLIKKLIAKSHLLPVPLADDKFIKRNRTVDNSPLQLLWNHRWEYDKGPDRLLAAIEKLLAEKVEIDFHIVGQQFRKIPNEFKQIKALVNSQRPDSLKHWGYIEDADEYRQLLASCDVVLSTAIHDFQGLAVLEAVAAGCVPLIPVRLCYPEWFSEVFLYGSYQSQPELEAQELAQRLDSLARQKQAGGLLKVPSVDRFSMKNVRKDFKRLCDSMMF